MKKPQGLKEARGVDVCEFAELEEKMCGKKQDNGKEKLEEEIGGKKRNLVKEIIHPLKKLMIKEKSVVLKPIQREKTLASLKLKMKKPRVLKIMTMHNVSILIFDQQNEHETQQLGDSKVEGEVKTCPLLHHGRLGIELPWVSKSHDSSKSGGSLVGGIKNYECSRNSPRLGECKFL